MLLEQTRKKFNYEEAELYQHGKEPDLIDGANDPEEKTSLEPRPQKPDRKVEGDALEL